MIEMACLNCTVRANLCVARPRTSTSTTEVLTRITNLYRSNGWLAAAAVAADRSKQDDTVEWSTERDAPPVTPLTLLIPALCSQTTLPSQRCEQRPSASGAS